MFFLAVLTLLGLSSASDLIIVSSDGALGPKSCAVTCAGTTKRGYTNWAGIDGQLFLPVDISSCGFKDTPIVTVTVNGDSNAGRMTGTSSVVSVSKTRFYVTLKGLVQTASNETPHKVSVAEAKSWRLSLNWVAHGYKCL